MPLKMTLASRKIKRILFSLRQMLWTEYRVLILHSTIQMIHHQIQSKLDSFRHQRCIMKKDLLSLKDLQEEVKERTRSRLKNC